jgi:adenylosuccinate synthase
VLVLRPIDAIFAPTETPGVFAMAAVAARVQRLTDLRFAKDEPRLGPFVAPVKPWLRSQLGQGERIIIEGTQGFGLSLLHSEYYPHVTSRDTTAAAFVAEAGLSPLDAVAETLIRQIEASISRPVDYIGIGPATMVPRSEGTQGLAQDERTPAVA